MALDTFEREPEANRVPHNAQSSASFNQLNDIVKNPQPLESSKYDQETYIPPRVSNVQKNYKQIPSEKDNYDRVRPAATAGQVAGVAGQGVGSVVQGTGKVVSGVSKAVAVVPIVGTPISTVGTTVGKGVEGVGKGVKKVSKKVTKTSSQIKRNTRTYPGMTRRDVVSKEANVRGYNPLIQSRRRFLASLPDDSKIIKAKAKSRSRVLIIIGWIISFPIVVFNSLSVYFFYAYTEVQDGGLWDIAKSTVTFDFSEAATKTAIYLYPEEILGFIIVCWLIGCMLAGLFLFFAFKIMSGSGAQTRNSIIKEGLFLTALVAVFIPMANVWPWANTWIRHVGKHPE